MFEIAAIATVVFVGAILVGILAVVGFVLKLAFKIVLIPLTLIGFLLKALLVVVGFALALALVPVGLVVLLVGLFVVLPVALLAGAVGFGFSLVGA